MKGAYKSMAIVIASTENMSHEEWLNLRKIGLGGSDAAVCCGINKFKSKVQLWLEKTGQFEDTEAGEAAYWGTLMEDVVREEFTKRTGIAVTPINQLLQSEEHPFMIANLDGMCEHPIYGPCIFEAKTSSAYRSNEWEDSLPDEYLIQVQHYMAVTGAKGTFLAVLIGGNHFKWQFIERDEELIKMLIQLEAEFWNHVEECIPPVIDGSDAALTFLNQKFPNSIPKTQIELPENAAQFIHQYETACAELAKLTEQKQEAENRLKELLGNNEAGTIGENLITWKTVTQERLDSKTLKAEHPVLFKRYANPSSYRRFSIRVAS